MRRSLLRAIWPVVPCLAVAACAGTPSQSSVAATASTVEQLRVEVIDTHPHDPNAYTQGLVLVDGRLYEGTGIYGQSSLRELDPETGAVLRSVSLDNRYFGEGIAAVDDRLIQLTWQEHTALVYRQSDLAQIGTFAYDTQGWGLCDDGTRLIMSDGSSQLYLRDRSTFALLGTLSVLRDGAPIDGLNELECAKGHVYANLLDRQTIIRIDPSSGSVTADIDASGLLTEGEAAQADIMNGIAHDARAGTFLLTGKRWPTLFEVRFAVP